MNSRDIISLKKDILQNLSKRQLKDAFESLMKLTINTQDWKITETLSELETNYKFMLHYLFEGVEDPERESVYHNLLRSLYELADDSADELLRIESSNVFYEKLRVNALKSGTISDYTSQLKDVADSIALIDLLEDGEEKTNRKRELAVKRERIASDMFNMVFVSPRSDVNDFNNYISFINNFDLPVREKSLFLSAVTLSLFHRFDFRKIQVLMQASVSENIQLRARAIVGLVVVMQMYDVRWPLYPELQNQLDILSEKPEFRKAVLRTIIQLIRSRETEQITKKIKEEILPEMMKFNNLAGRKLNMDELMGGDTDFSEKNPEWQKELEESGLGKKLQEYSNLQMEGADVFHSTFSGLKNFSFFSDIGNWFLPFDPSYSEFSTLFPEEKKSALLQAAVVDSGHMCNSDKYSFCLSLLQIPAAQREMMLGRMGAESEEIKQLQKEAKEMNPAVDEEVVSNQYIQDLYRFFKLNPSRNSFYDIFRLSLNFYDKKSIAPLISNIEDMKKIALYCFEKNNFGEALDIFNRLIAIDDKSDDIWQKIGYCRQMINDLDGALDAYLQADLLKPDNSWIIKRIAQLYRSQKQPELSLEYYKKAAKLTPDNINIELNIGHCYLELNDYEQALNTYFKVELLDSKGTKAQRPIAWTAFLQKKYDLAQKYYIRILAGKPTVHDYLNAGHVELCMGNKKKSIEYYKQALYQDNDFELFQMLFDADRVTLINHGVDGRIFPFLFDQVKYGMG
ncbi:tetratricopeptide repeat protein [Dysgonomonas termitidis]|uniref:Tetratricopeptide repeat protein n=1 Tax=Dysgonomonas termitidis TaxID=1516126 RepID=A0ABV9L407_9BACT